MRSRGAESAPEEVDADEALGELGSKLTSSVKSKDALLKHLKQTAHLLEGASQESKHTKIAAKTVANALVNKAILHHKDKDVKLLVALSLTHILRLNAPDSPYGDDVLQDIYRLFAGVFRRIYNATGSSMSRCLAVLETFAQVRCGVLLLDLYNDELLVDVVLSLVESITPENRQAVEPHMLEALAVICDESDDMSQQVLDAVLGGLLKKDDSPAAYTLTQALLRRCEEALHPHIQKFLSAIIVDGKAADSELRDDYHDIIYEVYLACPQSLLPVLPHLSMELQVEDEAKRTQAIGLLGRLLCLGEGSLASDYRQLFTDFLKRFTDKNTAIRLAMLGFAREFLPSTPNAAAAEAVAGHVRARLQDVDDKVRLASVSTLVHAEIARPGSVPMEALQEAAGRIRDKKVGVRREASSQLASLFRARCARLEETGGDDYSRLAWVAVRLLRAAGEREMRQAGLVDQALMEELFPAKLPAEAAARHWVAVYRECGALERRILHYLLQSKHRLQLAVRRYLDVRQRRRASLDDEQEDRLAREMDACVEAIALHFPDPVRAGESMAKLAALKDGNVFKDISALVSPGGGGAGGWRAAQEQLLSRLGAKHPLADFARQLSSRAAFNLLSQAHVAAVLGIAKEELDSEGPEAAASALGLLREASASLPALLSDSFPQLLLLLQEEDSEELAGAAVEILAAAGRGVHKHAGGIHGAFKAPLLRLLEHGTPRQAKHAVQAMVAVYGDGAEAVLRKAHGAVASQLADEAAAYNPTLPTLLRAAGCIAQHVPAAAAARGAELFDFVTGPLARDGDATALAEGLKALARACLPHAPDKGKEPPAVPAERVKALVRACGQLLPAGAMAGRKKADRAADKVQLRLAAASALLRLARRHGGAIGARTYLALALTLQDPSAELRSGVAARVHRGVSRHMLGARFAALWAMMGTEPDDALSESASRDLAEYIANARRAAQIAAARIKGTTLLAQPEYALTYAAYLVARHPDFPQPGEDGGEGSEDEGEASTAHARAARYAPFQRMLLFLLEPLLTGNAPGTEPGDNVQTILAIFRTVRGARDAWDESPAAGARLAVVCDVGIALVMNLVRKKHWQVGGAFPGAVHMPRALYKAPPEQAAAGGEVVPHGGARAGGRDGDRLPQGIQLLLTYKAKGSGGGGGRGRGGRSKPRKGAAGGGGSDSEDEDDEPAPPARKPAAGGAKRARGGGGGRGRSKVVEAAASESESEGGGDEDEDSEGEQEEEEVVEPAAASRAERAALREARVRGGRAGAGAAAGERSAEKKTMKKKAPTPPAKKKARASPVTDAAGPSPASPPSGARAARRGLRPSSANSPAPGRSPAAAPGSGKGAAARARRGEASGQENASPPGGRSGGKKGARAVAEIDLFGATQDDDEPPPDQRSRRRRVR